MSRFRLFAHLFAGFLSVALVAGCGSNGSGGGTGGTGTPAGPSISVAISPQNPVGLTAGATQTFGATVSNDSANAGVTWTASVGSITSAGVYTAPVPITASAATVTATSKTDPTKSASVSFPLLTPITVTIIPIAPVAMISGATQAFTATVINDSSNAGVTWSVVGGGSFSASSTASGTATIYTAANPVTATAAVVKATSIADPTKYATVNIPLVLIAVNPVSPSTANLGSGGSQTFTDSVLNDSSNSGVSWSIGSNPGTLTGVSATGVTYNAPTTLISSTTTLLLTATSIKDPSKTATSTITLFPVAVTITPNSPAAISGGSGQAFAATVANDSSNSGVTWTVTGGGLFSAATTLSGIATTYTAATVSSTTTATVTATSVKDPSKSASVSITVNPSPIAVTFTTPTTGITLDAGQTLALTAAIANDASASGATFATIGAGTVNPASAAGNSPSTTLTATGTVASTVTVTATSIKDSSKAAQSSSITVNPALAIATPAGALTAATTGSVYGGAMIATTGGSGAKTFAIASGALPAGLTINSNTGVITGTPTGPPGTATFSVKVTDSATTPVTMTSGTYSITVATVPLAWVSPTASTLTYTVGTPITPITLSASGGTGAIMYKVNTGSLPQGLSVVGSQVTGTPTAPTVVAGNAVTFLATDSATPTAGTAVSASVTLIANPIPLTITPGSLPAGTVGAAYSYQLATTGGTGTVTWSLSSGSLTGTGLTLSTTGLLSGIPTTTQSGLSLTFQAQDSATNQQQTKAVTLPLTVANALTVTTTGSLPIAALNAAYTQSLAATGGSGTGYAWTVTAGASSLAGLNLSVSSAGVVSGTPTTNGTANFTVQVKDSANNTASASFAVTTSGVLALPAPNPVSLGVAAINAVYSGTINATGGTAGYTWTVNGSTVPTNGTSLSVTDGLSVSNAGGSASLSVTGVPTSTGTVTFTASIKDSTNTVAGPFTYSIVVANVYTVGGNINSSVGCTTSGLSNVTVSINTVPVQTTTTTANGSFSFVNVPNGTYTITPSINGSSSAFYPATETVVVNGTNLTATSITATLGYSVSGTVAYAGTQSGQIYLTLNPTGSCGGRSPGTSVTSTGAFTIRGVPPGTYTLQAFMDNVGDGVPNASNPTGTTTGVNPTTTNISGVNVTLSDPAPVVLTTAPTLTTVSGFNSGAMAQYKPITNSGGLEMATYYTLQWSTSPTFATIAGSKRFPANGTHSNVWFLHGLTNGSVFYFRTYGTSGGTVAGPFSTVIGPVTITAPTVGNVVTGSVSFAAPPTGPLYVGFYDQGTSAFYGQFFASPVSAQPFTIQVPSGLDYLFVGVVDQNNDGAIDAGDITNTGNGTSQPVTVITGALSNQNLTLPSSNGVAAVTTQNTQAITSSGTLQNYNISFQVNGLIKQPVAAALASGPNLITPVDIAICGGPGSSCSQGFQISFNLYGTSPTVGDSYTFAVSYSDGTTGTLTASVTDVLNAFASNLSPQTGTSVSTTPTFVWTDPVNASSYTYQFYLADSSGHTVWQIPVTNSSSNGFSSGITSVTWGTDPTGGSNTPAVGTLTLGTSYLWQITVQDSNGNAATTQVQYQP